MRKKPDPGKKSLFKTIRSILIVILLISLTAPAHSQKELDVITNSWMKYSDASNSLYHHLTGLCYTLLDKREEKISGITNLPAWQERQKFIKETLNDIVGPFPEKTALNARIVRTIDKGSFRVEHIIYESLPGFYVTSSLYIPGGMKRRDKAPAVIYCSGHSAEGYRSTVYQHVILNLVTKDRKSVV